MKHTLASRLALDNSTDTEVSPAVSMEGFNAAQIEVTAFRMTGTTLSVTIQLSNDNENWRDLSGSTEAITAEGFHLGTKRTGIAAAYIRLKYVLAGAAGEVSVLAAAFNQSKQQ